MIDGGNQDGRRVMVNAIAGDWAEHNSGVWSGRIGTIVVSANLIGCYVAFDDDKDAPKHSNWCAREWLEFIDEKPDNKPLPLPG